jgi:CBS domain-containing protein
MTPSPVAVPARALVLDGERLVGIVSPTDLMRALATAGRRGLRFGVFGQQPSAPLLGRGAPW